MNQTLLRRNRLTATMMVAVLLICTAWSLLLFVREDFNLYDNRVRLLVSKEKNQIEKGIYEKGQYPYLVFDLKGNILHAESPFQEKVGDNVHVQEMLQYDQSFSKQQEAKEKISFVLEQNGAVNGFVVFLIPEQELKQESQLERAREIFFPLLMGIAFNFFMLGFRVVYANRCVLKPLGEISRSAKAIIAGNYDLEVVRIFGRKVKEDEIGDLTYSFELMRDELKAKQVREAELKKSQQELISCISHDLKTPLSTIKAYSEGLRDQIVKTPEKQKEYAAIILNKTDVMIDMIEDLLEYSNAQLRQLDINLEEIYFRAYFEELMLEVGHFVRQNNMEFQYHIGVSEVITIIDKKRITEVIYNLVENSMKYRGDHLGKIEIKVERQDSVLWIKVMDNGIGISSDDIPYVFDKFYRSEKSRSSSVPGSGLGLSICKYIINEHKGEIYCKSRKNQGCEIGFSLPL